MNVELELTEQERNDLLAIKRYRPFRAWFAVKPANQSAIIVDSLRKAKNHAAKFAPAAIYAAQ